MLVETMHTHRHCQDVKIAHSAPLHLALGDCENSFHMPKHWRICQVVGTILNGEGPQVVHSRSNISCYVAVVAFSHHPNARTHSPRCSLSVGAEVRVETHPGEIIGEDVQFILQWRWVEAAGHRLFADEAQGCVCDYDVNGESGIMGQRWLKDENESCWKLEWLQFTFVVLLLSVCWFIFSEMIDGKAAHNETWNTAKQTNPLNAAGDWVRDRQTLLF